MKTVTREFEIFSMNCTTTLFGLCLLHIFYNYKRTTFPSDHCSPSRFRFYRFQYFSHHHLKLEGVTVSSFSVLHFISSLYSALKGGINYLCLEWVKGRELVYLLIFFPDTTIYLRRFTSLPKGYVVKIVVGL